MLDHVIDSCLKAAKYTNRHSSRTGISVEVAVLTPENDPIAHEFNSKCIVLQGSEHDVLERYWRAAQYFGAHYIARITGDCPLIPPYLIHKMIKIGVCNNYDYVSNVANGARTAIDGFDCEVMSRKLLRTMDELVQDPSDREHVTTYVRRESPRWANMGCVIGFLDDSTRKLSVDTEEDLEAVRREYDSLQTKYNLAAEKYGPRAVHRV